ncbi:MAG: phosphoribosylformylglycinamidine synthase subunit PurS [Thermoleophilia bacterium]|nr:phosphoribosylformylglycinamidine synthase subunit PurS [Thermoleophilia bacterium]
MFKVSVYVTPKQAILDPQGATIERALPALGFEGVENIRVGRFITLEVDGSEEDVVRRDVEDMCRRLLANPIIEDYRFELVDVGPFPGAGLGGEVLLSEDTPMHVAGEHAASPWTAVDPYAHREEKIGE